MPQPIFFRVGTKNQIDLSAFVDSVRDFLFILKDVDATISEKSHGSVKWMVDVLEKRDAAIVGVIPVPHKPLFDRSSTVESEVIKNTTLLSTKGERNKFFSDGALTHMGKLATRTPKIGPMAIWTPQNGKPRQESEISQTTLRNFEDLTGPKYSGFGSVTGSLDAISVHRGAEFRIWDRESGKPVRCFFDSDFETKVKDYLRKNVVVTGDMLMNSAGNPLSIKVNDLEESPARPDLVPIQSLSGIIKDFTGGLSLKKYLEESADE
jgi:hypothetical protein